MKTAIKLSPKDQLKIERQYLETLQIELTGLNRELLNEYHSYSEHLTKIQRIIGIKKDIEKQTKKIAKMKEKG